MHCSFLCDGVENLLSKVFLKPLRAEYCCRDDAEVVAEGEEIQVLVTNLLCANEDAGNIRFGATADTVVRTYLDEYKPEHVFRLLKSGIGMDKVYLHRGSRVVAMFFIAGVAGDPAERHGRGAAERKRGHDHVPDEARPARYDG